jgi:transcriptional regulator with XRE-family HTH domain
VDSTDEELINRLQSYLETIRKTAGWTGERLADELGITKQTVSSLETGKNPDDEDALPCHPHGLQQ